MAQPPVHPDRACEEKTPHTSLTASPELIPDRPEADAYERMETFLAEREKLDYLPKLSPQKEMVTQN